MEKSHQTEMERDGLRAGAFFDLDGTLTPLPSLERRFFRALRYRRAIPARNYSAWLKEAARLLPRGITTVMQANKMYLKDVPILDQCGGENTSRSFMHSHQGEGQASVPPKGNPRLPVPRFFPEALQRMEWHTRQGHPIVLVSGTLEPLAKAVACVLQSHLECGGIVAKICVCATKLEGANGRWTGKIVGDAMFGEGKARAVKMLAEKMQVDLAQSWAYGDGANDRWLLEAVGKPVAVNPSRRLLRIAKKRDWPVLQWYKEKNLTQSAQRREHRKTDARKPEAPVNDLAPREHSQSQEELSRNVEPCT